MQNKSTRTTSREEQEVAEILRYNPLRFIREAYIRFLQGLFYAAPKGWYHWEPNPVDTDIIITDESPLKPDTIGKRPAITCTRGPVAFFTVGIDDMLSYDLQTGAKTKTTLLPGTMSINCCSRVPLEAEQLAWVVSESLFMLRDTMRQWGFYDIGRNLAIGAVSPPGSVIANDAGDEWYIVTLVSPFQIARMSKSTPLGKRAVSSIETTLSGNVRGRIALGTPYYNGADMPYATDGMLASSDRPTVGGSVNVARGGSSAASHSVRRVAHPLNPDVQVTVRAARPGDPIARPPSIRGRAIPISQRPVEESLERTLDTRVVKT